VSRLCIRPSSCSCTVVYGPTAFRRVTRIVERNERPVALEKAGWARGRSPSFFWCSDRHAAAWHPAASCGAAAGARSAWRVKCPWATEGKDGGRGLKPPGRGPEAPYAVSPTRIFTARRFAYGERAPLNALPLNRWIACSVCGRSCSPKASLVDVRSPGRPHTTCEGAREAPSRRAGRLGRGVGERLPTNQRTANQVAPYVEGQGWKRAGLSGVTQESDIQSETYPKCLPSFAAVAGGLRWRGSWPELGIGSVHALSATILRRVCFKQPRGLLLLLSALPSVDRIERQPPV